MKNSFFLIAMLILSVGVLMAFKPQTNAAVAKGSASSLSVESISSPTDVTDYRFMVKGKIQQASNQTCGMMIQTEEGLLEVLEMPEHDFDLKAGQDILISYETQTKVSACGANKTIVMYDFDLSE